MPEVWVVDLTHEAPGAEQALSDAERERAGRFMFPRDRRRFVRTRAALRTVLAGRLDVARERVELAYGPHGAPHVAWPSTELRFSVTHSADLALIAVASARRIGVDAELLRSDVAAERIAGRWFHPGERSRLERCPAPERAHRFFDYWTAKEAYVKALELGLRKPLAEFEVEVRGDGRTVLVSDAGGELASEWTFHPLAIAESHAAMLAVHGSPRPPRILRLPDQAG